jgi:hypothetical protein
MAIALKATPMYTFPRAARIFERRFVFVILKPPIRPSPAFLLSGYINPCPFDRVNQAASMWQSWGRGAALAGTKNLYTKFNMLCDFVGLVKYPTGG